MKRLAPWWFITLVILALFPLGSFGLLLSACPAGDATLRAYIWMYPLALIASAWYAIASFRTRTLLAWIMLIFMVLIDLSMFYLCLASS